MFFEVVFSQVFTSFIKVTATIQISERILLSRQDRSPGEP